MSEDISPEAAAGFQGPQLLGQPLTVMAARDYVARRWNLTISRATIQHACARYRRRIEGRASDADPIDPQALLTTDPNPQPYEVKCQWLNSIRGGKVAPKSYLVDGAPSNLDRPDVVRLPDSIAPPSDLEPQTQAYRRARAGRPRGRKVGSGKKPTTPKSPAAGAHNSHAPRHRATAPRSAPRRPRG